MIYLAALGPTLGYFQDDSLTDMAIVFKTSAQKCPNKLYSVPNSRFCAQNLNFLCFA